MTNESLRDGVLSKVEKQLLAQEENRRMQNGMSGRSKVVREMAVLHCTGYAALSLGLGLESPVHTVAEFQKCFSHLQQWYFAGLGLFR